jgi:hypothetical protein
MGEYQENDEEDVFMFHGLFWVSEKNGSITLYIILTYISYFSLQKMRQYYLRGFSLS